MGKIEYYYEGVSLKEYCRKNDLNYTTIHLRISKLKKEYPILSLERLIIMAIREYQNPNQKYFYEGIPLTHYCKLHPEIKYDNIKQHLRKKEKEKGEILTTNEIQSFIEEYISKVKRIIKIKRYCEENNLEYKNVQRYVCKHRYDEKYGELSSDKVIDILLSNYCPFQIKFPYKETTLSKYCEKHKLSYAAIASFVRNKMKLDNTLNLEDVIEEGIKIFHRHRIIYYYEGIPLEDYAKKHNLNANSIRSSICRKRANCDMPLQEIVDMCVENYQEFERKYFYDGKCLSEYCKEIGLDYTFITKVYRTRYLDRTDLTINESIKEIVDYYKANPPIYTKYYFGNLTLSKFCKEKGYNYNAILLRIKNLNKNNENLNNCIENAILGYEKNYEFKKRNMCFYTLSQFKGDDLKEVHNISDYLKINWENVLYLINMEFSIYQAISMIWYFYDGVDDNDFKTLSDNGIEEIFRLVQNVMKATENEVLSFHIYDLVRLYKTNMYDSRSEILIRQKKYIYKVIYTLCSQFNISVNKDNLEDFKSEVELCLIELIERNFSNLTGEFIRYMDATIKGSFKGYLSSYKREYKELFLDKKFNDSKTTLNDLIADNNKEIEAVNLENNQFSDNILQILSNLDQASLNYILLRFQEDYSYEDLAILYKISIEEVKTMEDEILDLLRGNTDLTRKLIQK